LLAQVYLELIGGKQTKLEFNSTEIFSDLDSELSYINIESLYENNEKRAKRNTILNLLDNQLHEKNIKEIPNNLWSKLKD